jgi:hypothetical protein
MGDAVFCCQIETLKVKLLFYLVTDGFAQRVNVSHTTFCVTLGREVLDPVEQVPKYSGTLPEVPYNQHLPLPFANDLWLTGTITKENGLDDGGTQR